VFYRFLEILVFLLLLLWIALLFNVGGMSVKLSEFMTYLDSLWWPLRQRQKSHLPSKWL